MTLYPREEVIGRNCRFLQGKYTDRAVVAQIREVCQKGQRLDVELLNYRKRNRSQVLLLSLFEFFFFFFLTFNRFFYQARIAVLLLPPNITIHALQHRIDAIFESSHHLQLNAIYDVRRIPVRSDRDLQYAFDLAQDTVLCVLLTETYVHLTRVGFI